MSIAYSACGIAAHRKNAAMRKAKSGGSHPNVTLAQARVHAMFQPALPVDTGRQVDARLREHDESDIEV